MYIETVPNRGAKPTILLREGWREGGKVRKRTLANLTSWPARKIDALKAVLKGSTAIGKLESAFDIVDSKPHGHVAAIWSVIRRVGLHEVVDAMGSRSGKLVLAMIIARIIDPRAKLATVRGLRNDTATTTINKLLGIGNPDEDDLYEAMDWVGKKQSSIEDALATKHLRNGALVLYDVTTTYFEGSQCPLAKRGYSRDGKKDKLQIVIGLLCASHGCPVAIEVFEGNTSDPKTVSSQVNKLRKRFGLSTVILVGDRGMLTQARIDEDLLPLEGIQWISALRAPAIHKLVNTGALQLSLFDDYDLAEITSPDFPDERLIVCRNPHLANERSRKRIDLLLATEAELAKIEKATQRKSRPLRGKERIGLRIGKVINRFKMAKHFQLTIGDDSFSYVRKEEAIKAEAALDGIYVVRTNVKKTVLDGAQVVESYKGLAVVERAFRSSKSVDLKIRPIHHRNPERVRAHVFIVMLSYYIEWHMRQQLAPILFDDEHPELGRAQRDSVIQPAQRSEGATKKAHTKKSLDGTNTVHSFQGVLANLGTVTLNRIQPKSDPSAVFDRITRPSAFQQRVFDLLGLRSLL